jgi:hypothetical protein
VLSEFEKLAQGYVDAERERESLDLDQNAHAIYTSLKGMVENATPGDARTIDAVFGRYPDFRWNQRQQGSLRAELYKALRPIVGPALTIQAANALLQLQRV